MNAQTGPGVITSRRAVRKFSTRNSLSSAPGTEPLPPRHSHTADRPAEDLPCLLGVFGQQTSVFHAVRVDALHIDDHQLAAPIARRQMNGPEANRGVRELVAVLLQETLRVGAVGLGLSVQRAVIRVRPRVADEVQAADFSNTALVAVLVLARRREALELHPVETARPHEQVLLGVRDPQQVPALSADVLIGVVERDRDRGLGLGHERLPPNATLERVQAMSTLMTLVEPGMLTAVPAV